MSVRDFFNSLASTYRRRFDPQQAPWLAYWFEQRFALAAASLRAPDERILDVGCGTGGFYDHLAQHRFRTEYWGCDIADEMLNHSTIPKAQQILGSPLDEDFPSLEVDTIVVLGVSSYWNVEYLQRLLVRLCQMLDSETGQILISFTYSRSWDYQLRRRLQPLLAQWGWTKRVISQPVFATTPEDVLGLLPPGLQLIDCQWLPGTFPLFPSLSPRLALWVSQLLSHPPSSRFRTDFLVKLVPYRES